MFRLARRQHAWLLLSSTASAPEAGGVYFARPATVHARAQSEIVIAVDMPPAAAASDRREGAAGAVRASVNGGSACGRDRENLRDISCSAQLEGGGVAYGHSAPATTPVDPL